MGAIARWAWGRDVECVKACKQCSENMEDICFCLYATLIVIDHNAELPRSAHEALSSGFALFAPEG